MKIRMLTGISGPDFSLAPREVTDRFSDSEARNLVNSGAAELVVAEAKSPKPVKTAKA